MMSLQLGKMGWRMLLAGVLTLACSFSSHAAVITTKYTVHYAIYGSNGALKSDAANGVAAGDVGTGSGWLNNPVLANPEHRASYLVHFWIDAPASYDYVDWSFNWALADSGLVTGSSAKANVSVTGSITIGTDRSGWRGVSGAFASDALSISVTNASVSSGHPLTLGGVDVASEKVGGAALNGVGNTSTWAYVSGISSVNANGSANFSLVEYGDVTAQALVITTVADPVVPPGIDNPSPGGPSGGGAAVPEPGVLVLSAGASLMVLARRRRYQPDRVAV